MQQKKYWRILFVLLALTTYSKKVFSQSKQVGAVVINANTGKPIAGVNVQVKDRYAALTTTNVNGQFKLSAKADETLIFNNAGYHLLQVLVANLKDTLSLQPNVKTNDVIVTAYGESNRKNYAGAVATFDPTVITNVPVMPLNDALAGRLAGVQVQSGNGQPGTEASLFIRGNTSLSLTNTPLYVIDGLPLENFYTGSLNSMDIKSVSILKDANAAIYGARGSNGVVLIETKKGRSKQATVEYNAYAGINSNMRKIDMMSPVEFVKYQLELQPAVATNFYLTNPGVGLSHYQGKNGINWQNQVNANGLIQSHQLALSGISSQTNYYISASVFNQNGGLKNTANNRYQGRFGLQQAINKKIKVAINTNYSVN
ncbi:TonB-dependent receptor plug domain-containing protein, partial [Pedobacter sp.]